MKLVIQSKENVETLFPKETEPGYTKNVNYYDMKQLLMWEERFNEIQKLMNETDNQEGLELLFALAEEGYPAARYLLSDMYLEGRGLPASIVKGAEWYRRAQYAEGFFRDKAF